MSDRITYLVALAALFVGVVALTRTVLIERALAPRRAGALVAV